MSDEPLQVAYDAHAESLYRYALMIVADPEAAEDAVHQASAKLVERESAATRIDCLAVYLRTTVRNECYRVPGRRRVFAGLLKRLPACPILEQTDHGVSRGGERKRLERAIRRLPAEQREVLHLKVYEGQTFGAIAALTGVSLNTAASP
ncbi:MAG: sigma-70 family RNA polymerase sigma factor [Phycisphaerales bacterium]|nr:MAG: sigma-70 family RNA polymerase sigma factor [Phycisphaerales bacterium]